MRPKYFYKDFYVVKVNGYMYWHNSEKECGNLHGRLLKNISML